MAMLVHLAPEDRVASIRRNGIARLRRATQVLPKGIFAVPVTPSFYLSHQWLRELRRRDTKPIAAIYFRIADDEPVWVGRYNEPHAEMTAAAAGAAFLACERREGWEVLIPRRIAAKEIHRVRSLPQVLGWRYFPGANAKPPTCTCRYCTRGAYGAPRLRKRIPRPDAGDRLVRVRPAGKAYTFRPATQRDLPLLGGWLRTPEVARWWGEPEKELALLMQDLAEPQMVMRIVSMGTRPFAYAQDYEVHSWPQAHLAGLPAGTRAVDTFIGVPGMLGCGHGGRYLRLLAEQLMDEGAPLVAIDPSVDNMRARSAYRKAGFRGDAVLDTPEGPVVLMIFDGGAA